MKLGKLSAGQFDEWRSRGWTLVPAFLGEERLMRLRRECDRLMEQPALFDQRGMVPASPRRSDRLDPVIDVAPEFHALAHDPGLRALVGEALGGEAQLLKDKFIAKPPGTGGYGLHVDGAYWLGMDLDLDRFATAMIFLDDATSDKGTMECASGWLELAPAHEPITDPREGSAGPLVTVEAAPGMCCFCTPARRTAAAPIALPSRAAPYCSAMALTPGPGFTIATRNTAKD